jgi:hypothetical protein
MEQIANSCPEVQQFSHSYTHAGRCSSGNAGEHPAQTTPFSNPEAFSYSWPQTPPFHNSGTFSDKIAQTPPNPIFATIRHSCAQAQPFSDTQTFID